MRRAAPLLAALGLLAAGCATPGASARPTYAGPPKAFKLLAEAAEVETESLKEKRTDLLVTVESGEPVPAVVAVGEIGPFSRQGGTVKLYGDEAGTEGWSVDNFLLLEVNTPQGQTLARAAIGFQQGCSRGSEQIDSLGQFKFAFGPGEVDISTIIPAHEQVTIKATVLDTGGVGKVSNLFAILTSEPGASNLQEEELRDR